MWGVESLAPEGVTIRLVVKTQPAEQFRVLRELRGRIKPALDAAGVDIATAQRTLVHAAGPQQRPTAWRRSRPGLSLRGQASGGEGDRDGERVADLGGELGDHAGRRDVVRDELQRGEALGGVGDDDALDVGAHRALGLGLGPPDLGEDVGGDPERERVGVAGGVAQRRPRRATATGGSSPPATTTRPLR